MRDLALYYPYIHVRDDAWLKAAALHWPKLARLRPSGYPTEDSPVARVLDSELGFVVNVDPSRYTDAVAEDFMRLLVAEVPRLRMRYGIGDQAPGDDLAVSSPSDWPYGRSGVAFEHLEPAFLHLSKFQYRLLRSLDSAGLAQRGWGRHGYSWVRMHPELASVYMTCLADRVAAENAMSVVTDQPWLHGLLNGWRTRNLAQVLLAEDDSPADDADQVAETYAVLAIRMYVPANLATVPVKRIVKARKVLLPEFHAFREHLESLYDHFAEIAQVKDSNVREAKLQILLESKVRVPGADLEQTLRKLGFEPARAVLSAKTPALPAAVTGLGVPPLVAQGALVAGRFVSAVVAGEQAAEGERRNAYGYLLGLREELDPRGVVDRVRRTFRHMRRR